MKINPEIKAVLNRSHIPVDDGTAYLLSLHFGLKPSFIPEGLVARVRVTKIVTLDDKSRTLQWNFPMFEGGISGFEWTKDWLDKFSTVNKDRRGNLQDVTRRMKEFFINNPSVRVHEVVAATDMYMRTISNPVMLKTSHKFIYEGVGASKYSHLLEWVEKFRETEVEEVAPTTLTNQMQ